MNEVVLYRRVLVYREHTPCRDSMHIHMRPAVCIACDLAHLGMFAAAKT